MSGEEEEEVGTKQKAIVHYMVCIGMKREIHRMEWHGMAWRERCLQLKTKVKFWVFMLFLWCLSGGTDRAPLMACLLAYSLA